ncbi:MAG: ATP-binding protein [Saprospiraceae bacterium]
MTRRYLIIIFFLSSFTAYSQSVEKQTDSLLYVIENTSSDSLVADLHFSIAWLNLYSDPLKTVYHCRQTIDFSERANYLQAISNAYILTFNAHLYHGAPSDTLLLVIKTLENHVMTKMEESEMMRVYWIYALYYDNIKQLDKSTEAYINALKIVDKYADKDSVTAEHARSSLRSCIGDVLLEQGKMEEALDYLESSLETASDPITIGTIQYSIGKVYNELGNYEKANLFFKDSYQNNKKGKDTAGMARALIEEGKYFDREKYFERANGLYQEASSLIEENEIGSLLPVVFVAFAQHKFIRKDYASAIKYGEQALAEIETQKNYNSLTETYKVLQDSYAAIGNYENAYDLRGKQMSYRDSVNNSDLSMKVEALKTEFEVAQKETENDLLKAEAIATQKSIEIKNATAAALLLGLLLLGSWAMVVFRSNKRKQKYNEQLEAKVEERTSELKKANSNLAQLNYELKTFNHIASHHIKEPIMNIGNYVGLIYHKLPVELQEKYKDYFQTIKNSTSQLYTVVEDYSNYTKLSKGEEIELDDVNLNTLLEGMEVSLGSYASGKQFRIINEGLPTVHSNSSLIYTVMKNIIDNGLKFNESNTPTVFVNSEQNEKYTKIFIKDNGIGIDPAYQKQIFEMFKRLHHRQKFQGSGVGLAVVKLLMDKLGGNVEIESNVNEGSVFILQLPN